MLEKQNVTLSLPKSVLRKAKKIAIDRNTSLSGLMIKLIADLTEAEDQYTIAKQKHLAWLSQNIDLGTNGQIDWSRDSLYER